MSLIFTVITNSIRRPLDLVEKSLRTSLAQPQITQVTFVDQNDIPLQLASSIVNDPKLNLLRISTAGVSSARNAATYLAHTEWLIFCDDDGYLADDYMTNLQQVIAKNPTVEIFAGGIRRIDTKGFYSKRHALGGDLNSFFYTKLLMGSNFVVRRSTFERLGKFDENFGAGAKYGSSEETDFAWNAYFEKINMMYSPELVVFHVPPFAGAADVEVQKAFRYGVGKGALVAKWLIHKRQPIVIFEIIEMLIFPLLKSVASLLMLNFDFFKIQLASLKGRTSGLFQYHS